MTPEKMFDGPIPGENYTSDTRNYPWHRPPEYKDIDLALDAAAKKLMDKKSAVGILTLLESGLTVASVTTMFVISGVGAGKWTPDFAVLMAGPVARMIELMAKGAGIDYTMGTEEREDFTTINFFKGLQEVSSKEAQKGIKNLVQNVEEVKDTVPTEPKVKSQELTGFMSEGV